ncbi:hypothetical protein P3T24_007874 [Paraburkholderia sp. GAS33]|uniref:hypothetical protein n=1 Tax=Paraburkholderia sp. GAS33 TaxID=3035130 RepID=UPI003D1CC6A6
MDTTSRGTFAFDTASADELFAAMDRRDAAIAAKFVEHVARVMGALGLTECFGNTEFASTTRLVT